MNLAEAVETFQYDTSAVPTNRGFYYQHLLSLKSWLESYSQNRSSIIYLEDKADILEIGEEVIFTETKCYARDLRPRSDEFKRTAYYFYLLFLQYRQSTLQLRFVFQTTAKFGKDLEKHVFQADAGNYKLLGTFQQLFKTIILEQAKKVKNDKLSSANELKRTKTKDSFDILKQELECESLAEFMSILEFQTGVDNPDESIEKLESEALEILGRSCFKEIPPRFLLKVTLSEIFRRAQREQKEERKLDSPLLSSILNLTHEELLGMIDKRYISKVIRIEESIDTLKRSLELVNDQTLENETRIRNLENLQTVDFSSLPKEILPILPNEVFWGRAAELSQFAGMVAGARKPILIHGLGGTGKTAFCIQYWQMYQDEFEYILWLESSEHFLHKIAFDEELHGALQISFQNEDNFNYRHAKVTTTLCNLQQRKLLVIDNVKENPNLLKEIHRWQSAGWQVICISQSHFSWAEPFFLPDLMLQDLQSIFEYRSDIKFPEISVHKLFQVSENNPLLIDIVARMLKNAPHISIDEIIEAIMDLSVDSPRFEISIYDDRTDKEETLVSKLVSIFSLDAIHDSKDQNLLIWLVVAPLGWNRLETIVEIAGGSDYETNYRIFLKALNKFERIGILARNGNTFKIHRLIRWAIIYQKKDFDELFLQIAWLAGRVNESITAFDPQGYRWTLIAEEMLKVIPERKRTSMTQQPLLTLENGILQVYRYLGLGEKLADRQAGIIKRLESAFIVDTIGLSIAHNNLGMDYLVANEFEKSRESFVHAIEMLEKGRDQKIEKSELLLNCYLNLSYLLLEHLNLKEFQGIFLKAIRLSRASELNNNRKLNLIHDIQARLYSRLMDFQNAASTIEIAIRMEEAKETPTSATLTMWYSNLSFYLAKVMKWDKAASANAMALEHWNRAGLNIQHQLSAIKEIRYMIDNKIEEWE